MGILGTIGGSILAGGGIILRAAMLRQFMPVIIDILGGIMAAAGGWFLGSQLFSGNLLE